jgi:hypothetical protein
MAGAKMRKKSVFILISGALLSVALVVLHNLSGDHAVQRPWLYHGILPALGLSTIVAAWFAWKQPIGTVWKNAWWEVGFVIGGLTLLQGNPSTPLVHMLLWASLVIVVSIGLRRYGQALPKHTV